MPLTRTSTVVRTSTVAAPCETVSAMTHCFLKYRLHSLHRIVLVLVLRALLRDPLQTLLLAWFSSGLCRLVLRLLSSLPAMTRSTRQGASLKATTVTRDSPRMLRRARMPAAAAQRPRSMQRESILRRVLPILGFRSDSIQRSQLHRSPRFFLCIASGARASRSRHGALDTVRFEGRATRTTLRLTASNERGPDD